MSASITNNPVFGLNDVHQSHLIGSISGEVVTVVVPRPTEFMTRRISGGFAFASVRALLCSRGGSTWKNQNIIVDGFGFNYLVIFYKDLI